MIGQRIRQLRLARGLSLEVLAAEMGGLVTKQALSKYEHDKSQPSRDVLNKLASALQVKAVQLWREPDLDVTFVAYRKKSRFPKREQEKIESLVQQSLEERIQLQELIQQHPDTDLPIQKLTVKQEEEAEKAADDLRKLWNLGQDPIASVVNVLEDHFIHVFEIDASEKFDGISAFARDGKEVKAAAVVTRKGVPGERQRLNLTHELGHLVLKISEKVDEEKAAFRFGAAFLAPSETVFREVGNHRSFIQTEELLLLKQRFGLSIQALLYRLRDLDVITESYYKQWCIHINRLRWRKQEPFEMPPEKPHWMRQSVLRAFSEDAITQEEAERMLGEDLEMEQPLSLIERRAFMNLPLEERRRILAEQAKKMVSHYAQDSEWKDFQGGDIIEY